MADSFQKIPRINSMRFGIIDEKFVNTATSLANDFGEMKPQIERMGETVEKGFAKKPIFAKILASEAIKRVEIEFANGIAEDVDVAWRYEWVNVTIADEATIIPTEDGHPENEVISSEVIAEMSGGTSGLAYNVAEMANVALAPIVFGVDMEASSYPAGFRPMPMTAGEYVMLQQFYADDAHLIYVFERTGIHDGLCAEMITL